MHNLDIPSATYQNGEFNAASTTMPYDSVQPLKGLVPQCCAITFHICKRYTF